MMRKIKRTKLTDKTEWKGHRETGVERETGEAEGERRMDKWE